ncbi:cucurbitadienol 11-hydroxylase-like [Rhodamnia argentea]|uniref:Cucurbitadienol 11-hydroxylase-like n=1 Tax=Rhodamnia argentea TaxID=178133 RepID=A0A8B8QLR8_9MYRT|nr:cucurbitadienol 11-hydroxylase-like [Rhodamnia argentea]
MWSIPILEIVMGFVALIVIAVSHWKYKWRTRSSIGKLPPGSMGFPLIGETIQFLLPSKSIDIPPFLKKRIKRYGPLFKTHLVGRPAVVSADPEFNRLILREEGKSVEMWYLDSFAKLVGHDATTDLEVKTNATGHAHKHIINVILKHFGPERLKDELLPQLQAMAEKALDAWSTQDFVEPKRDCAKMIFGMTSKLLFSYDAERPGENLVEDIDTIFQGLMSLPLNIPGTTFHKSLESQRKLIDVIEREITERMASPGIRKRDILGHLLEDMKTQTFVTRDWVTYTMVGLTIASIETISTGLVMIIKLLTENPQVAPELIKENEEALCNRRISGKEEITWEEYKSLAYTMQVINESLRLASIAPAIVRRTLKDIHWNGCIIPKDWTIMMVQTPLHLNPEVFVDPLTFDPSRWKQEDIEKVRGNYYVPFGGGGRPCSGSEFTKAWFAVFLQVLVTKYRWTKVKGGEVGRTPLLAFRGGFHVKVSKIQE